MTPISSGETGFAIPGGDGSTSQPITRFYAYQLHEPDFDPAAPTELPSWDSALFANDYRLRLQYCAFLSVTNPAAGTCDLGEQ